MTPSIPDASEGQRPSASAINQIRDAAVRDITGPVAHSDSSGTVLPIFAGAEVSLYELTGETELDDTAREYKATAKLCVPRLVAVDGSGHYTGDATSESRVCRYRMITTERDTTIWFPAGARDTNAEAKTKPPEVTGSRVWTTVSYGRRIVVGSSPSALTPFQLVFSYIKQSTNAAYDYVSQTYPISAVAVYDDAWEQDEANTGVTVLAPTTYQDPCFSVTDSGLWFLSFFVSLQNRTITTPTWTGTVSGATCSMSATSGFFPVVHTSAVIQFQAAAGGAWTTIENSSEPVYFFQTAGSGVATIRIVAFAKLTAGDKIRIYLTATATNGAASTDEVRVGTAVLSGIKMATPPPVLP